jgi:hypothetical protein
MKRTFALGAAALVAASMAAAPAAAQDRIKLRMSTPASETDQRSVALQEVFAPAVAEFAEYEPHYNASLIAQNSELEAIASGDLEMSIASAQELAQYFPEFSIFATGYVHRSAEHQVAVFNDPLMDPFKRGRGGARRQAAVGDVSRPPPREPAPVPRRGDVQTPDDLAGSTCACRAPTPGSSSARRSAPTRRRWPSPRSTPRSRPARSTGRTTRCRRSSTPSSTR